MIKKLLVGLALSLSLITPVSAAEKWFYGINSGTALTGVVSLTKNSPELIVSDGATITLAPLNTCKGKPVIIATNTNNTTTINGTLLLSSGSTSSTTLSAAGTSIGFINNGSAWVQFIPSSIGGGGSIPNAPAYTIFSNLTNNTAPAAFNPPINTGDLLGFNSSNILEYNNISGLGTNSLPIQQGWCKRWVSAVAQTIAGIAPTNPFNVYVLGDSVTAGVGLTNLNQSYPLQLVNTLNQNNIPAREGVVWASSNPLETRWVYTGGWFQSSIPGGLAGASGPTGALGSATCTTGIVCDTVKVLYAAFSGGGTFTVSIDGSVVGTINSNNATNQIKIQNYAVTRGTHVVSFSSPTAQVYPVGVWSVDTTSPAIYITNSGKSGLMMSTWDASGGWPMHVYMQALQPSLVITNLGINDAQNTVTVAAFTTAVNNTCTTIQSLCPNADILLIQEHLGSSAGGGVALQQQYAPVYSNAAKTFKTGFLDMGNRWGPDKTYFSTILNYGGPLHPNNVGHIDYARGISNMATRN